MISGAFSIIKQSIALGCFPRMRIVHTSASVLGQIYIPAINWILMCLTVAVVAGFQSGTVIGADSPSIISIVFMLALKVAWQQHLSFAALLMHV